MKARRGDLVGWLLLVVLFVAALTLHPAASPPPAGPATCQATPAATPTHHA